VTTTDAAAAWHTYRRFSLAVLAAASTIALGACSSTSLLGGDNQIPTELASPAQGAAPAPSVAQTKITVATVIGAPDAVGKQLTADIGSALERQRVGVAKPGEKADFTVRGYVVAAKEKAGTKVSYIWDLFDASGKRSNRITGEEIVPVSGENRDPWAGVGSNVIKTISDKTATQIANAIPKDGAAIAQAPSSLGSGQGVSNVSTASVGPSGSVTGGLLAVVPQVTGAPGDGSQALSTALQRELARGGVQVAEVSAGGPSAYRVEGKVALGQAQGNKQSIQIDWLVKDPSGKKLGTVSQKNEIPPGSLDGTWGQTADTAAAAAAQGIIKLLPASAKSTQ
jgi:hypothetical protein